MSIKNKFAVAFSAVVMSLMLVAPAIADSTVVVMGDTSAGENQPGWMFNRDVTTSTPYEFNTDEASIGDGSLYVMPIGATASNKLIAENFVRTDMGDINSITYDFMMGAGAEAGDYAHFYMNVYANYATSLENKFYDCRYNIVPTSGSSATWSTVTFDPALEYPVTTRGDSPVQPCPDSPADMGPDAFVRVFAINVGDTSASDQGLDGYLDNVVVNTDTEVTTYDFEPMMAPTSKDDCKKGGWENFNTPQTFKNQGECVSFMARMKSSEFTLDSANMDGIDIPTMNGKWQMVTISGMWSNRGGEFVDAECTSFSGSPWVNAVFGGYSSDLLDVQVNEDFISWGQCDADNHTYSTWVMGDGSPMNLRVFDGDTNTNTQIPGWFGDNEGSFSVMVNTH